MFSTTITPPTPYGGESIEVSATVGNQVAAVNIVFAPTAFKPSVTELQSRPRFASRSYSSSTQNGSTQAIQPFVYGASGTPGSTNPFANANPCFSNIDLGSTIPASCQPNYIQQGITITLPNVEKASCMAASAISGALSCAGTVMSIATCLSGVGALVCGGGLLETAPGCAAYVIPMIPSQYTQNPIFKTGLSLLSFGIQPGPPSIGKAIGLLCEALDLANPGTGLTGIGVTISPQYPNVPLGSSVQFSSSVSGTGNSSVTWAINGVPQASGIFGTISANGLYSAPASLTDPTRVTITATSTLDTSAVGGTDAHIVAAIPGTVTTVAGNGTGGYTGDTGAAVAAKLSGPSGIAFDDNGNMFIADSVNNAVRRVDAITQAITTIAGNGVAGYTGDGGAGTSAELNSPSHVVFDRTVNLYITDANSERIRRVDAVTDIIATVAGNGNAGFSGDGGAATSAQLSFPNGVALDSNGNLLIGDAQNNRIREVDFISHNISTVAGNGAAGYSGDGGLATNARLSFPSRPFVDLSGNIYIADYGNNRVRKVSATTGIITTIAGTGTAGYSGDGGLATSANLNGPISVILDSKGALYIADAGNQRIRAVNTTATASAVLGITIPPGQIMTVVGNGTAGYAGDGGPATAAQVNGPTGLTIDLQGNLVFADSNNNVVRKVIGQ
jgi:hypothetical protein